MTVVASSARRSAPTRTRTSGTRSTRHGRHRHRQSWTARGCAGP